ncbi:antitoxin VbhA family protein [Paenibacillus alba]|nr:antitoxin VbhA family protein [Paenibacillus alba]
MIEDTTDYAFRNAKASLEIEGQTLPTGSEELILQNLRGELSEEEFLQRALEIALGV